MSERLRHPGEDRSRHIRDQTGGTDRQKQRLKRQMVREYRDKSGLHFSIREVQGDVPTQNTESQETMLTAVEQSTAVAAVSEGRQTALQFTAMEQNSGVDSPETKQIAPVDRQHTARRVTPLLLGAAELRDNIFRSAENDTTKVTSPACESSYYAEPVSANAPGSKDEKHSTHKKQAKLFFSQQETAAERTATVKPDSVQETSRGANQESRSEAHSTVANPEHTPKTRQSESAAHSPGAQSKKQTARLHFSKEELPAVAGKAVSVAAHSGEAAVHRKVSQCEQDNAGVEAAHKTEIAAETGLRLAAHGSSRLHFQHSAEPPRENRQSTAKATQKERLKKRRKKQHVEDAHRPAAVWEVLTHPATFRLRNVLGFAALRKRWAGRIVAVLLLLVMILVTVSACVPIFLVGAQALVTTSWLSADTDIQLAEQYYTSLEAELQQEVNTIADRYQGYDEYRFNLDEVGHDPTALISYLSVLPENGIFQYTPELQATLDSLFEEQYTLSVDSYTEERTTTRTVQVGESIGTVVTSAYCNCEICCGQWSGGPTASGVYPTSNHTLAVDAYHPTVPMGTELVMNGTLYKVEDTGNFARYGVDFDVYMDSHQEALNWGHRTFEAYLAGGDGESIEITTTEEITVCAVTLHQKPFSQIVEDHLTEEQAQQYQIYMESRGNRPFLATPVQYDWRASVVGLYGERCVGSDISEYDKLDISMPSGTEVFAPFSGTVIGADDSFVTIHNERGYEVSFYSLGAVSVQPGQVVEKGGTIGRCGSSPVRLSLSQNGTSYNPYFYFQTGEGYAYGGGSGEEGHPAVGDAAFQRMLAVAERQLGTPYVWGGSSPGGFDCSGFVCYVLNQSGVRDVGRTSAQGLYDLCSHVGMGDAKPGDLIFFTGTYSSDHPVTHVGIYVGNGQMIHAGDPIKYSSIYSSYWQSHFYAMGRP